MLTIEDVKKHCRTVGEGIATVVAETCAAMREFFDTTYWC